MVTYKDTLYTNKLGLLHNIKPCFYYCYHGYPRSRSCSAKSTLNYLDSNRAQLISINQREQEHLPRTFPHRNCYININVSYLVSNE